MRKIFSNLDWYLLGSMLVLLVMGLTMIRSVAPELFGQQLLYILLGAGLLVIFSFVDYRIFFEFRYLVLGLALLGLMLTFAFGAVTRGSVRWLQIAGLTIQPSELAKPLLITFFAAAMAARPPLRIGSILNHLLILFLPALLIFIQPDLGSTMVVVFFWFCLMVGAGLPLGYMILGVVSGLTLLPLSWKFLKDYQKERIATFLNPFADPLDSGYNMIQAMIAVGSGQLLGRGLGRGPQSHLRFLPERHTDFIFASLSEELGFLGALILVLTYALLLARLLWLSGRLNNRFSSLVCLGVFSMIFFQVFINIGMNLGLVPITGVTLPLVSYGGSSLFSVMISLGIAQSVYRRSRLESL